MFHSDIRRFGITCYLGFWFWGRGGPWLLRATMAVQLQQMLARPLVGCSFHHRASSQLSAISSGGLDLGASDEPACVLAFVWSLHAGGHPGI